MERIANTPAADREDVLDRRAARRIAYMDASGRLLASGSPAIRTVLWGVTVLLGAQAVPWLR